jgi:hypothetical protein
LIALARIPVLAAALFALAACSSDSLGPADGPLTGDWTYEVLNVRPQGDPVACSYTDVGIRFEQRGGRLTGFTAGGFGTCTRDGSEPFPNVPLRPATITGGTNGTQVSFAIGDFILNAGTVTGDEISGTATFAQGAQGAFTMRRR